MPALIRYVATPSDFGKGGEELGKNQSVALIGEKEELLAHAEEVLKEVCPSADIGMFKSVVSNASIHPFSGGATSMVAPGPNEGGYTRIHALLKPSTCSRHNAPGRPDTIYGLALGSLTSPENQDNQSLTKVILITPKKCFFSSGCAVARAFPLYTRKGNAVETKSDQVIEVTWYCSLGGKFDSLSAEEKASFPSHVQAVADGIREAARLVDAPCNEMSCSSMVREAEILVGKLREELKGEISEDGITMEVIQGKDLEAKGYGGIWGVGKAADDPPALVTLVYTPKNGYGQTFAMAGKGIVYDTGGMSMKSPLTMPGMKRDMGGSAGILHGWGAAVRNHKVLDERTPSSFSFNSSPSSSSSSSSGDEKKGVRLVAVLCLAENQVGPLAARPDDIHLMFSGKTVEINNTDAEGRLVLGDGVAHAMKYFSPDVLLNMCTLTGAQGISTGNLHASIVCNNDGLEEHAVVAGKKSGDLTHPLLFCPELFQEEFASKVADMKNSVANRANAQSSCAAQFIYSHIASYTGKWLHVDMAYPVKRGERATGYGVALLNQLFVFPDA